MSALVPLETLAREINACHDKAAGYDKKAEEFRVARDQKIVEAHTRIGDGEIDMTFAAWCEANLTISRNQVHKILRRLEGPKVQEPSGNPDYQIEPVQSKPTAQAIDQWQPSEKVHHPVEATFSHVEATLTTGEFVQLIDRGVNRFIQITEERDDFTDEFIRITKKMVARANKIVAERKAQIGPAPRWDEIADFYASRAKI